jgi:hypothetical protein
MKSQRLEQGHCFPGIGVLLALYNIMLYTAYKPDAKIKPLPFGHQPSGPLDLCLVHSFLF